MGSTARHTPFVARGRRRHRLGIALAALMVASVQGCGSDSPESSGDSPSPEPTKKSEATSQPEEAAALVDGVVKIEGDRGLYVRCTGTGSPTVIMAAGDESTADYYAFAEETLADVTRTCVYDRANLGQSDPDTGPRGLAELVGDLESFIEAGEIPGPYVMVGSYGGGYIVAGYAFEHPEQIAGMVLVEATAPFLNAPPVVVELTRWDNPENVEQRDFLLVEKDAWAARRRIGDIPMTVISTKYPPEAITQGWPGEASLKRTNVQSQRGWLRLSPRAEQVVFRGSAVEHEDPDLIVEQILDVVEAARQ